MTDETYNGWTNRETWAFNLHWQNDHGLYLWVLERAAEFVADTLDDDLATDVVDFAVGEYVIRMINEELAELSPELWENMREDVGSFWRVNEEETGACVRESQGVES